MDQDATQRKRLTATLADLDQRIERQVAVIESGVDPVLVGERIRSLKGERQQSETALAQLDLLQRERIGLDLDEACAVLDCLPDLSKPLAKADPELRRSVYEAFQFGIELDRNKPEIRLKALVSSAFSTTSDLDDLAGMVANGVIAGAVSKRVPATTKSPADTGQRIPSALAYRIEEVWSLDAEAPVIAPPKAPEP